MRLELRFSKRPLEGLPCQAVVILAFSDPDLPRGELTSLYDMMKGFLPALEKTGFWTGSSGETLLLASQGMIGADKILLKGLGEKAVFDAIALTDRMAEVGVTLDGIGVNNFGIHIPIVADTDKAHSSHLELAARHLVEPFLEHHWGETDFTLKIIFFVGKYPSDLLTPVILRLRAAFSSIRDLFIGEEQVLEMAAVGGI
ncbi:MAG: hypothetical protein JW896_12615 [Deltaproteobacteria bacterium]|nr:hypothetical protein [Deltaproteobacteria bacterium]